MSEGVFQAKHLHCNFHPRLYQIHLTPTSASALEQMQVSAFLAELAHPHRWNPQHSVPL